MKPAPYILPILLLAACAAPVVSEQRTEEIDGNKLMITSGTFDGGRFITVANPDKRWVGRLKGGKEKWGARKALLEDMYKKEMRSICGEWAHLIIRPAAYNMLDKDETMGGAAPVLGIAASMAAYAAAYSSTDEANIPVSVRTEFRCRKDEG